jgi:hypothetical protein
LHNETAEDLLEFSIYLIASLYSIKHIRDGHSFPPDSNAINHVSESFDKIISALEKDEDTYFQDLATFYNNGLKLIADVELGDIDSFKHLARFCLYVRALYLLFNGYEDIIANMFAVSHMNVLAKAVGKRASELLAYWESEHKKKKTSMPGVLEKKRKLEKRVGQLMERLEEYDTTDGQIEIPREEWERIFLKDLKIWSSTTKAKYKKMAEKLLSKKINIKK